MIYPKIKPKGSKDGGSLQGIINAARLPLQKRNRQLELELKLLKLENQALIQGLSVVVADRARIIEQFKVIEAHVK